MQHKFNAILVKIIKKTKNFITKKAFVKKKYYKTYNNLNS